MVVDRRIPNIGFRPGLVTLECRVAGQSEWLGYGTDGALLFPRVGMSRLRHAGTLLAAVGGGGPSYAV